MNSSVFRNFKIFALRPIFKLMRWLAFPFLLIFAVVVWIRNLYFNYLWNKQKCVPPLYCIVVGNLSTGGTGKTPFVLHLLKRELADFPQVENNQKPIIAVLSRGYGRSSTGFRYVKSSDSHLEVGDEPLMMRNLTDSRVVFAVCEDRMKGLEILKTDHPHLTKVILDDAFQHRAVHANEYYLLTTCDKPFFSDYLLPVGRLREFRNGASRANHVVITKCPKHFSESLKNEMLNECAKYTNADVSFARLEYGEIMCVQGDSQLKNYNNFLLVTGIANFSPLTDYLFQENISFKHIAFPDHKNFSPADINNILKSLEGNQAILTTEKDWVRLRNMVPGSVSVFVQPVHHVFDS